jgi:Zn-finger nucleic acid-binding protein
MKIETLEDMQVPRCPVCHGLLLERGKLEELLKKKLGNVLDNPVFAPTPEALDEAEARCFECDQNMELIKGPFDVFVNWCSGCSRIFLDQGELASLQIIGDSKIR